MKNYLLLSILLFVPILLFSQKITGIVQDKHGIPIYKAMVLQKNTTRKAYTDGNGQFSLTLIKDKPKTLIVSHELAEQKEVAIGKKEHITISLVVKESNYEVVREKVEVKAAETKIKVVKPAEYETFEELVLVENISTRLISTPMSNTATKESAAGKTEPPKTNNKIVENLGDLELISVIEKGKPAVYTSKTRKVLKTKAVLGTVTIPAEYEYVNKKILIAPGETTPRLVTPTSAKGSSSVFRETKQLNDDQLKSLAEISGLPTASKTTVIDNTSLYNDPSIISAYEEAADRLERGRLSKEEAKEYLEKRVKTIIAHREKRLAGVLTAGEVNDFAKWTLWNDISQEVLARWSEEWKFYPKNRYVLQVHNKAGIAIVNAKAALLSKSGKVIWEAKTDNTGKAELWHNLFEEIQEEPHKIRVFYKNRGYKIRDVKIFENGINFLEIPVRCESTMPMIDLAFVVDATASMEDEIDYLKAELKEAIRQTKYMYPKGMLNTGAVFYRDHDFGDNYLTRISKMNHGQNVTLDFIRRQDVKAGLTTPEAVTDALEVGVNDLGWRYNATTRLLFLILDAPSHDGTEERMAAVIKKAAAKGIRIIPVVCAGAHIDTEYLMRSIALATNGTYTFLTDDSGVGQVHIKPTTDSYKVETLNEVFLRLIRQFTDISSCSETFEEAITVIQAENEALNTEEENPFKIEFFPNPSSGIFNIKTQQAVKEVFVTDMNGKILLRQEGIDLLDFQVDLSDFAAGIYVVLCKFEGDKWASGRVVKVSL